MVHPAVSGSIRLAVLLSQLTFTGVGPDNDTMSEVLFSGFRSLFFLRHPFPFHSPRRMNLPAVERRPVIAPLEFVIDYLIVDGERVRNDWP